MPWSQSADVGGVVPGLFDGEDWVEVHNLGEGDPVGPRRLVFTCRTVGGAVVVEVDGVLE